MVCGFTGHRPEKLPWGTDETDPRCQALKILLRRAVEQAADAGADTFCCGMARGCDFDFAEAVLELTVQRPHLRLEAWLPCPSQADRWRVSDRTRRESILQRCSRVHMVEPIYAEGCMLRRDQAMTDQADCLITVWDGSPGGTGWTVRYAQKRGIPIAALWL